MSRFYGDLTGQAKTTATRRGSANSGVRSHVRGWDLGIRVEAFPESEAFDGFRVYVTAGSNGGHGDLLLAEVIQGPQSFDVHIGERFRELQGVLLHDGA